MVMIEGKDPFHRLARDVVDTLHDHWRRESDFEPQITVAQTTDAIVIQAESYNTESLVVTIAHTNRRLAS